LVSAVNYNGLVSGGAHNGDGLGLVGHSQGRQAQAETLGALQTQKHQRPEKG